MGRTQVRRRPDRAARFRNIVKTALSRNRRLVRSERLGRGALWKGPWASTFRSHKARLGLCLRGSGTGPGPRFFPPLWIHEETRHHVHLIKLHTNASESPL